MRNMKGQRQQTMCAVVCSWEAFADGMIGATVQSSRKDCAGMAPHPCGVPCTHSALSMRRCALQETHVDARAFHAQCPITAASAAPSPDVHHQGDTRVPRSVATSIHVFTFPTCGQAHVVTLAFDVFHH